MGAALAVLRHANTALRLTAAKSRFGHSEPVAGTVGISHAAATLLHHTTSAVMHLRSFNPLLTSLIQTHKASRFAGPYVARQDGTGLVDEATAANWQAATGVSAFAFQGTNAHALLVGANGILASRASQSAQWQRQRFWFSPKPHVFVSQLVFARPAVHLQARLQVAALAYLWDHRVQNRALLPGAAMLETAVAAGMLLMPSKGEAAVALASISIPAPLILYDRSGSGSPAHSIVLGTTVDAASGRLAVGSTSAAGTGATHLTGSFAYAACICSLQNSSVAWGSTAVSWLVGARLANGRTPPTATAHMKHCLRYQAGQYYMHPAIIDNATQASLRVDLRHHQA